MNFNGVQSLVRSFSTSVKRNVKAPVQVFGLEGKYATALYSAGVKEKKLETVEKELQSFQGAFSSDKVLQEFLLNPVIQKSLKVKALESISKKLSLSNVSANFLALLAENGRLKNYQGILFSFNTIMAAHRGDILCEVTSAKPLDDATKKEIQPVLSKFAKKGENIIIKYKTDPNIIGGLVVSIADKYVDMSIATKIKKYSDLLKSTV